MKLLYYVRLAARSIRTNKRIYYPYLVCGALLTAMFYILFSLNAITNQSTFYGRRTTAGLLNFGLVVFGVLSLFILFLMNTTIIKNRIREFGLYSVLGMNKRNIIMLLLTEIALMAIAILIVGIGLGMLFLQLTYLILVDLAGMQVRLDFVLPAGSIVETIAVFGIGFALVFIYDAFVVLRSKTVDMVYGSKKGERSSNVQLILSAVFGLAVLIYAYVSAQTAASPLEALQRFFFLALAVIVATYYLFISGSIAVLQLLKRRKSYYKPVPFITVSGMLYRMKKNAVGIASICVLSTCALVTLSGTTGLFVGSEQMIRYEMQGDFIVEYLVPPMDPKQPEHTQHDAIRAQVIADLEAHGLRATETKHFFNSVLDIRVDEQRTAHVVDMPSDGESGTTAPDRSEPFLASTTERESWIQRHGALPAIAEDEVIVVLSDQENSAVFDRLAIGNQTYRVASVMKAPGNAAVYTSGGVIIFASYDALHSVDSASSQSLTAYLSLTLEPIDPIANKTTLLADYYDSDLRERYLTFIPRLARLNTIDNARADYKSTFGTLMFLGVFFSLMFLVAASTIMYYKQISEGIDDRARFLIMRQLGMDDRLVRRTTRRQILWVFLLPIVAAALHVAFAFRIINQMLELFGVVHIPTVLSSFLVSTSVFALFYFGIYLLTARVYRRMLRA